MYIKEKEICPAYISEINSNCEKQVILLMTPNEDKKGWHYLAVKKFIRSNRKKVTNIDKDGNENVATISHKIKISDSTGFMASLLSNLVNNLAEGIHKIKCKECDCFLEY